MKLIYNVEEKPVFKTNLVFAFQQLLTIIAATLLVPTLVNLNSGTSMLNQASALFGAGIGTLVYIFFTQKKSPVFLGSSFAFISPLVGACAFGYFGIIIGALIAGAVYMMIALIIHFVGTGWVEKLMPPVVIGPTVALIGLSLCASAISNVNNTAVGAEYNLISILCGLIAFGVTVMASTKGNNTLKRFPFIAGIIAGYAAASIFTAIGSVANIEYLKLVDFSPLVNNFSPVTIESFISMPEFTFVYALKEGFEPMQGVTGFISIFALFAPVAFVVFAEHIADHENLSSIIERDLIKDPGLKRTLIGDGVGSIAGAFFGGCPNTTYGESVGCVAITGNASVSTLIMTALMAIILSFFTPFAAFVNTIPVCVIGGICIALYGFIAVSGLKMLRNVDLDESKNLFVVSGILVTGIGGLTLQFGNITISPVATALIVGILTKAIISDRKTKTDAAKEEETEINSRRK